LPRRWLSSLADALPPCCCLGGCLATSSLRSPRSAAERVMALITDALP
jgi:hypothetical protein